MPELPEVENLSLQLQKIISGWVISEVVVLQEPILEIPKKILEDKLPGKKILNLSRRGKFLRLQLANDLSLWFHLGMTGQLFWGERPKAYGKHTHLVLRFKGLEEELMFNDIRRFGKISLTHGNGKSLPESIQRLGPEPLEIAEESFAGIFHKRKGRIKSLLLNQTLLAGIGNIYADESLYQAGIDPRKRSSRLNRLQLGNLYRAIRKTLAEAIEKGGSSVDDYIHIDGSRGFFQNFHQVYGREGKPCFHCSNGIRRIRLAGRSAHFCPTCQK